MSDLSPMRNLDWPARARRARDVAALQAERRLNRALGNARWRARKLERRIGRAYAASSRRLGRRLGGGD